MRSSGFPVTNRDSAAQPRNLRLSNESRARHALELNNLVREILQGVDQFGARQRPCTVHGAEKRELGKPRLLTRSVLLLAVRSTGGESRREVAGTAVARTEVTAGSQVSEAQTRSKGTGQLTEHGGRCVARRSEVQPSWHPLAGTRNRMDRQDRQRGYQAAGARRRENSGNW